MLFTVTSTITMTNGPSSEDTHATSTNSTNSINSNDVDNHTNMGRMTRAEGGDEEG